MNVITWRNSEVLEIVAQTLSALAAIAAAVLWFDSARVVIKQPRQFPIVVVRPDGGILGQPLGGQYAGHGYSDELQGWADQVWQSFSKQSRRSAYAAICAGASALFQVLAIAFHILHL